MNAPVICCDLDGVIWRGDVPIPGSASAVAALREAGARVVFLTNNSSGRIADYVERLGAAGIEADGDDVGSSAQAAAALVAEKLPPGARVLACAGPGVVEALEALRVPCGRRATGVGGRRGLAPHVRLRRARPRRRCSPQRCAVRRHQLRSDLSGRRRTVARGGAIVAAVATAAGRAPAVAGKPHAPMVALVRARFGNEGVMVGDRPSTDGALAAALGWPFALVLSGVVGSAGEEQIPDPRPALVGADLAAIVPELSEAAMQRLGGTGP